MWESEHSIKQNVVNSTFYVCRYVYVETFILYAVSQICMIWMICVICMTWIHTYQILERIQITNICIKPKILLGESRHAYYENIHFIISFGLVLQLQKEVKLLIFLQKYENTF